MRNIELCDASGQHWITHHAKFRLCDTLLLSNHLRLHICKICDICSPEDTISRFSRTSISSEHWWFGLPDKTYTASLQVIKLQTETWYFYYALTCYYNNNTKSNNLLVFNVQITLSSKTPNFFCTNQLNKSACNKQSKEVMNIKQQHWVCDQINPNFQ